MSKSLMIVDDSATMRKIIMRTVRMSGLEFERTEGRGERVHNQAVHAGEIPGKTVSSIELKPDNGGRNTK